MNCDHLGRFTGKILGDRDRDAVVKVRISSQQSQRQHRVCFTTTHCLSQFEYCLIGFPLSCRIN